MVRVRTRSGKPRPRISTVFRRHPHPDPRKSPHSASSSDHAHSSHSLFPHHDAHHSADSAHKLSPHSPRSPGSPHSPHSHSIFRQHSHFPSHSAQSSPPSSPTEDKLPHEAVHAGSNHHESTPEHHLTRRDSVMSELEEAEEIGELPDNTTGRFQLVGELLKSLATELFHHWVEEDRDEAKAIEKMVELWHDDFLESILPRGDGAWYLLDDKDYRKIIDKVKDLKEKHVGDFFMYSHGALVVADSYRVKEVIASMKLRKHHDPPPVPEKVHHHLFEHHSPHSPNPAASHHDHQHKSKETRSPENHGKLGGLFSHHDKRHEEHRRNKPHEGSHEEKNKETHEKKEEATHETEEETRKSKETSPHRGFLHRHPLRPISTHKSGTARHFRTARRTSRSLSHEGYRIGHRQAALHEIETYGDAENGGLRLVPLL
ncbi:hypothetical protein JCM3765_003790 [Sporobolomyces pararoseus]